MRIFAFALAAAAATSWCVPASGATIVQNIGGNQRVPGGIDLFDASLGTLNSVKVEGTVGLDFVVVRDGFDGFPDLTVTLDPTAGLLFLGYYVGPTIATASLIGNEHYSAGEIFGAISFSGSVFALLTGASLTPFIGDAPSVISPEIGALPEPVAGHRDEGPGDLIYYSLKVTYDYAPFGAVPEPSTWAMMLLGFGLVGWQVRRSRRSTSRALAA